MKKGFKHSDKTKKILAEKSRINNKKGLTGFQKGHPCYGGVKFKKGQVPWNKGLEGFLRADKHYNWKGGISKRSYPKIWTKELRENIRKRDNYTCQNCGMIEEEHLIVYGMVLPVHHIDYNKDNCSLDNLIALCTQCNLRANYNRPHWFDWYKNISIYEPLKNLPICYN